MERLVRAQLVEYLEFKALMDDAQHGAKSGRSTVTQLLLQHQRILEIFEDQANVELVFLDFSKAFDVIDHSILLAKLAAMGVRGKLLEWIRSFITGRRQRVRVNGALSDWVTTTSGIAQGSVLGPLLFLVYIQDLGVLERDRTGTSTSIPNDITEELRLMILK